MNLHRKQPPPFLPAMDSRNSHEKWKTLAHLLARTQTLVDEKLQKGEAMTELEQIALRGFKEWWAVARTQPPYSNPEAIAKSAWLESRRLVAELGQGEPVAIYHTDKGVEWLINYQPYEGAKFYAAPPAAPNAASFATWTGCGECDCSFKCYDGEARCIRLPNAAATQEGSTQDTPGDPAPAAALPYSDGYRRILVAIENFNEHEYSWRELLDEIRKIASEEYRKRPLAAPYFHDPASSLAEVENAERAAKKKALNRG